MGMNTSAQMTMQMPAAPPVQTQPPVRPAPAQAAPKHTSSTAGMSAIRKVTAGLTASSRPTPIKPAITKAAPISHEPKTKKSKPNPAPASNKRKRPRTQHTGAASDSDSDATTPSSASTRSTPSSTAQPNPLPETTTAAATPPITTAPVPLTMTKSGRQVLKPAAYNPAAMDAASKRARGPHHHYGKRTAEQALCRRCSRMHSPAANQIVFCDGCDGGWHQLCHEPRVADDVVRDQRRAWFCRECAAKRERQGQQGQQGQGQGQSKKQRVDGGGAGGVGRKDRERERAKESWAGRPAQQKRAYLSTLAQQELVGLLMACLEVNPDLPIFPASVGGGGGGGEQAAAATTTTPRSLFAGTTTEGLFTRAEAHPTGQINFVRKVGAKGGKEKGRSASGAKGSQKEDSQERMEAEEDEFDPLAALWPRVGMGMYARLLPDTEDEVRLADAGDYEAFSVIVYDDRGRKVEENGMKV